MPDPSRPARLSVWRSRVSPSPQLSPPLIRVRAVRAVPTASPVARGWAWARGRIWAVPNTSNLAIRAPISPAPSPTGRAQKAWKTSAHGVAWMPSAKSGWPARPATSAATPAISSEGQIRFGWKRRLSSSATKITPIRGVLKAPARPAPAAAASNSLLRRPRPSPWATAAPSWAAGPSLPIGSRARLAAPQSASLPAVVPAASCRSRRSGRWRASRSWGKPEPAERCSTPAWSTSSRGTVAIGARARSRAGSVQLPP